MKAVPLLISLLCIVSCASREFSYEEVSCAYDKYKQDYPNDKYEELARSEHAKEVGEEIYKCFLINTEDKGVQLISVVGKDGKVEGTVANVNSKKADCMKTLMNQQKYPEPANVPSYVFISIP